MNFVPCRIYTSDCIRLLSGFHWILSILISRQLATMIAWKIWKKTPQSFEHAHVLVLKPGDPNTLAYSRNVYRAVWRIQFLEQTDDIFAIVSKYTMYGYWLKWGTQSWGFNSTELILVFITLCFAVGWEYISAVLLFVLMYSHLLTLCELIWSITEWLLTELNLKTSKRVLCCFIHHKSHMVCSARESTPSQGGGTAD